MSILAECAYITRSVISNQPARQLIVHWQPWQTFKCQIYLQGIYTSRLSVKALRDKLIVSCQILCGTYLRTEWRPKYATDFRPTCPPGQTLHTCRLVPTVSSICKCRCLPVAKRTNRAFSSTLIRQMALAYEVAFALCGHWGLQNPG